MGKGGNSQSSAQGLPSRRPDHDRCWARRRARRLQPQQGKGMPRSGKCKVLVLTYRQPPVCAQWTEEPSWTKRCQSGNVTSRGRTESPPAGQGPQGQRPRDECAAGASPGVRGQAPGHSQAKGEPRVLGLPVTFLRGSLQKRSLRMPAEEALPHSSWRTHRQLLLR